MLEQMSEVCCGIRDGSVCTLYGFQSGTVQRDRLTASACGPGFELVYFPVAVTAAGSRGGRPRSRTAQPGRSSTPSRSMRPGPPAARRSADGPASGSARPGWGPTATATGQFQAGPQGRLRRRLCPIVHTQKSTTMRPKGALSSGDPEGDSRPMIESVRAARELWGRGPRAAERGTASTAAGWSAAPSSFWLG
jgi:hypothetical protein